ncbi:MAG: integrin alpha [Planctomycetota bacterium]
MAQIGGDSEVPISKFGPDIFGHFGQSVANAGDLNGDGVNDFLVGAPNELSGGGVGTGVVHAYSGRTGDEIYSIPGSFALEEFGYSVSGIGDLNFDGYDDFIIGIPGGSLFGQIDHGAAMVVSGIDGSNLYVYTGPLPGSDFGKAVSGVEDMTGDSIPDFVIAAPGVDLGLGGEGAVYLFSGADGSNFHSVGGTYLNERLGTAVCGVGDLTGDGLVELAISSPGADPGGLLSAGMVQVFEGGSNALLYQVLGTEVGFGIGTSLAGLPDFNEDGIPEFAIGARAAGYNSRVSSGSVFLISGADGSVEFRVDGERDFDEFGTSVSAVGNYFGLAQDMFVVGAPFSDPFGRMDAGTVYILDGDTGAELRSFIGILPFDKIGVSLAGLGDMNLDGLDDLAIGSPNATGIGVLQGGGVKVYAYNPFLRASTAEFSASSGALIGFDLEFPLFASIIEYRILFSGGLGSFQFGTTVPLAMDSHVPSSYFGNYPFSMELGLQGTLDTNGRATAVIGVQAGAFTSVIGRTFYLAAIANSPGELPTYSSGALKMTVLP